MNSSIIRFNVEGRQVNTVPLIAGMAAATAVALVSRRGSELLAQPIRANETHASRAVALLMGIPGIAIMAIVSRISIPPVRVVLSLALITLIFAAAAAWSGFRYIFSSAGVEVRTLGFRLHSIPAAEIRSYGISRWSAISGYGIRGIGDRRAYVWGNRGVKIQTQDGEVFLGHAEPKKLFVTWIQSLATPSPNREEEYVCATFN